MAARWTVAGFCILWTGLGLVSIAGGPALGEHEVIVAEIARQMLETGDWLVPRYLDTPFLMKPPLPSWAVAVASLVLPAGDSLAVTDLSARFPSLVATLLTGFVVWRLGRSMFGPRAGAVAAFVYATSLGALLFALNATAEALLTLFCTWAYAEFWWATRETRRGPRIRHLAMAYLAFGLGMLAKGPMPLIVLAAPLAAWWWLDRPVRMISLGGPRSMGRGAKRAATDALPRLLACWRRLGVGWGALVGLLVFVPWMVLVGRRLPYAWELWEYEYLDRLGGSYPGEKSFNVAYYVPLMLGLLAPWTLSVPEALVGPFLPRHRTHHAPLRFAWFWTIGSLLLLSVMAFKKSYYILPVVPACALLLAPVLDRFFFEKVPAKRRNLRSGLAILWAVTLVAVIVAWFFARRSFPREWTGVVPWAGPLLVFLGALGFSLAATLFARGQRGGSFGMVGLTSLLLFTLTWRTLGPRLGNVDAPMELVRALEHARIASAEPIYWASNRPDGRVAFYGRRNLRQVADPYKLIAEHGENVKDVRELRHRVAAELCRLLADARPVWCVMQRKDFRLLQQFMGVTAREVFSVDRGRMGPDGDDWVLLSNAAPRAAAEVAAHPEG